MKIFSKLINYFFVFVIFSVLSSCTQPKKNYLPPKTAEKIKSILVLPFDVCPKDTSKVFFCPVNIVPGQIAPDAQKVMNRLLRTKLKRFSRFYRFTYLSPLEFERIFDKIQQPLSENLLDIRIYKKIKWLTAEELANNGIDLVLQTFPIKEE